MRKTRIHKLTSKNAAFTIFQYDCNGTEPVTVSRRRRDASGDVTRIMSVTKMFQVGTKGNVEFLYLNILFD